MNAPKVPVDEQAWSSIQQETVKANLVREAIHLLDVSWHDLDVTRRFLKTHNTTNTALTLSIEATQKELGAQSDNFQQWLNKQDLKIATMTAELEKL